MLKPSSHQAIDIVKVRQRRIQLGLSEKRLAAQLGVSTSVITSLERGRDQRKHDLGFLLDLAEALSLDVRDLLSEEACDAPPAGDLARRAGALISEAGGPVPVEAICVALRCTLDVLRAALDELESSARAVGLALNRAAGGVSLVSAGSVKRSTVLALCRDGARRTNLPVDRAQLISSLVDGPRPLDPRIMTVAQVVNAGFVTVDDGGSGTSRLVGLSPDVRYALMLDDGESSTCHNRQGLPTGSDGDDPPGLQASGP